MNRSTAAPNPQRPKLRDEFEEQLVPLHRARAKAYSSIEEATARALELARLVEETDDEKAPPAPRIETEDEVSIVRHIEEIKRTAH